jgi:aspartyl-tRNA(Asn)/glutamyl-tRNA(Gln) amidotransferase subunit C
MKITDEKIKELAHLARLKFEGDELQHIKEDLEKITAFCEQLNQVDTDGIEPLTYLTKNKNVLREDVTENTMSKEEALKNAPKADSDFFRVPKVIKTHRG